jgi:hypothetical protein
MAEAAVQVAVRIRPLNTNEKNNQSNIVCHLPHNSSNTIQLDPPTTRTNRRVVGNSENYEAYSFTFDYVYSDTYQPGAANNQERVYEDIGKSVVQNALSGFNCCILAYGQTGLSSQFALHYIIYSYIHSSV